LTDNEVVKSKPTRTTECDSRNDICKKNIGIEEKTNYCLLSIPVLRNNETIVTNTRHYDSLLKALEEVTKVKYGLETNLT
jgi:tRNA modification GTPase